MASYDTWRVYGEDNNLPPPEGWAEHVPSGANNDIGRHIQAALARQRERRNSFPLTTGDAENTYLLNVPITDTLVTLPAGFRVSFTAHQTTVEGVASFQINEFASQSIEGTGIGVRPGDLTQGRRYEAVFNGIGWKLVYSSLVDASGELSLAHIPPVLFGKDTTTVDGFSFSTSATGTDANTLYFRTYPSQGSGSALYLGSTLITRVFIGNTRIRRVRVGTNRVLTLGIPPGPVRNFTAHTNVAYVIVLTWDPPTDPSGSGIPIYRFQRATSPDGTFITLSSGSVAVGYEDKPLPGGVTYYYRVRAENEFGNSVYTPVLAVTVPFPA